MEQETTVRGELLLKVVRSQRTGIFESVIAAGEASRMYAVGEVTRPHPAWGAKGYGLATFRSPREAAAWAWTNIIDDHTRYVALGIGINPRDPDVPLWFTWDRDTLEERWERYKDTDVYHLKEGARYFRNRHCEYSKDINLGLNFTWPQDTVLVDAFEPLLILPIAMGGQDEILQRLRDDAAGLVAAMDSRIEIAAPLRAVFAEDVA